MERKRRKLDHKRNAPWTVGSVIQSQDQFQAKLMLEMKYEWQFSVRKRPVHDGQYALTLYIDDACDGWYLSPLKLKVSCMFIGIHVFLYELSIFE